MIRSRLKRIAIVAGAGAVATMTTLAATPFSAGADGTTTPTTTTVTGPSTLTSGHAAKFTATVDADSVPVTKTTGDTVTFTIVGSDSSTAACAGGSNVPLSGKGKAICKVAADTLSALASPYTVTAVYSGDDTFGSSTGDLSQTVAQAASHLKLTYLARPTSGSSSTFTATVTGKGGSDPSGSVQFAAASATSSSSSSTAWRCTNGGNNQTLSASSATPPVMTATCVLSAKWSKLPAPSKTDPKPVANWNVTATYAGDGNYKSSGASKSGSIKG
jgi:hypothetical protein